MTNIRSKKTLIIIALVALFSSSLPVLSEDQDKAEIQKKIAEREEIRKKLMDREKEELDFKLRSVLLDGDGDAHLEALLMKGADPNAEIWYEISDSIFSEQIIDTLASSAQFPFITEAILSFPFPPGLSSVRILSSSYAQKILPTASTVKIKITPLIILLHEASYEYVRTNLALLLQYGADPNIDVEIEFVHPVSKEVIHVNLPLAYLFVQGDYRSKYFVSENFIYALFLLLEAGMKHRYELKIGDIVFKDQELN